MENADKVPRVKLEIEPKNPPIIRNEKMDDSAPLPNENEKPENLMKKFVKFQEEFKEKCSDLKKKMKSSQNAFKNLFKEKYGKFVSELGLYLQEQSTIIEQCSEKKQKDSLKELINSSIEKVNGLIKLQDSIQDSISQNFILLVKLFSMDKNFIKSSKYPNQSFFTKYNEFFINSWSVSKLDFFNMKKSDNANNNKQNFKNNNKNSNPFEQMMLNFSQLFMDKDNLPDNFKNLFPNSMFVGGPNLKNAVDYELNSPADCLNEEKKKFLKANFQNLKNLKLYNLQSSDFYNIFEKKEDKESPTDPNQICSIIDKLYIKDCKFEDVDFYDYFQNVQKLTIKNTKINLDIVLTNSLSKLKELYFVKLNLTTRGFDNVIKFMNKNKEIMENLTVLSFQNNKITKVVLFNEEEECTEQFKNLLEINFENNKIYKYDSANFNSTPELKLINLINNNLAFNENYINIKDNLKSIEKQKEQVAQSEGREYKRKKNLVLVAKNLFVLKGEERNEYFKYLNSVLPEFDYPMTNLTLETLFNLFNKNLLFEIKLSPIIQNNLKMINIAMCSLYNDDLVNFLLNCKDLPNLKKINAGFNFLTEEFFSLFIKKDAQNSIKNIEKFDFCGNEKMDVKNDFENLVKFANVNPNLKRIGMARTNFEALIGQFLKYKIREIGQMESKGPVQVSNNMKLNYGEMNNFISVYERINKSSCKFSFRELIPKNSFDKILQIASKELAPFHFKVKSGSGSEKDKGN